VIAQAVKEEKFVQIDGTSNPVSYQVDGHPQAKSFFEKNGA
jgi:hypothetical protein